MKMIESAMSLPSPRYGHAAAVMGVDMFVFGGYSNNYHNYSLIRHSELWRYNMINHSWSILVPTNYSPFPSGHYYRCYYAATARSGMLWISYKFSFATRFNHDVHFELWMFIVHLRTWNFVALQTIEFLPSNYFYSYLNFWQGYLLSLEHSSLTYLKAGCPEGLGSSNISSVSCDVWKVGFYSDVETNECRKCPNGTTTRNERSSRMTDCNVCVSGYCPNGRCLVVSNRLTQVPVCMCTIGFTGSHCQDASYYYIAMGVILVIGIITLFVSVLWRTRKRRKEREMAFRRHIQTLNDAWQISWQEIRLQDEIGGGASGRVWKAQYRDMDVAVKMLMVDDDPQSSLEFVREINLCKQCVI